MVLAGLSALAGGLIAQNAGTGDWERSMAAGRAALLAENYAQADAIFSASLAAADGSWDGVRRALVAAQLGLAKLAEGHPTEAAAFLTQSIPVLENAGDRAGDLATAWQALGRALHIQRRYAKAGQAYRKALALRLAAEPPDPRAIADLQSSLGSTYQLQGRYSEAEEALDRARELLDGLPQPDPVLGASLFNNIGMLYRSHGRHSAAEAAYRKGLRYLQSTGDRTGVLSVHLLNNLALECMYRKQYDEASALLFRAVARVEQASAVAPADQVELFRHYARCLEKQGRKKEARQMIARADHMAGAILPSENGLVVDASELRAGNK